MISQSRPGWLRLNRRQALNGAMLIPRHCRYRGNIDTEAMSWLGHCPSWAVSPRTAGTDVDWDASEVRSLEALAGAAAGGGIEDRLADADGVRGHFDAFVVGDELERLLQ